MNVHAIAEKYRLTVGKVRQMEKDGVLICTDEGDHPLAASMRNNLANRTALSVLQLCALIENPKIYAELRRRQNDARAQVSALGTFKAQALDAGYFSIVRKASDNDPNAVETVAEWVRSILPGYHVAHAWLAVRAIYGIPNETARAEFLNKFNHALINCRKGGYLDGYWKVHSINKKNTVLYRNELLDL